MAGFKKYVRKEVPNMQLKNTFYMQQLHSAFLEDLAEKMKQVNARIHKISLLKIQQKRLKIDELQEISDFVTYLHKQNRIKLIEACSFFRKQYAINQKKLQKRKMIELEKLINDQQISQDKLDSQLDEMQKEVNEQYHEKIYMFIEPKVVKLQRMFRKSRLRVKVKLIVDKAMKFYNIVKLLSRHEKEIQVYHFRHAVMRMAQRNSYFMCARALSKSSSISNPRFPEKERHLQWIARRQAQKAACRTLRLNFVVGLINRFYLKWHKKAYPQEQPAAMTYDFNKAIQQVQA